MQARFPVSSNAVQMSTATANDDQFVAGVRFDMLGTVVRVDTSNGALWHDGLLLTGAGQVVVVDATAGLPSGVQWLSGLPFAPTGELCISSDPAVSWQNGLPFVANGALAATVSA